VLWKNGNITDLGALTGEGGHSSTADAVNSRGQVVGGAFTSNPDPDSMLGTNFQTRAFLWQNGVMQDLGTPGGPDAQALMINEKGQVVGDSYTSFMPNNGCSDLALTIGAFIWENGKMTDLGNFGGTCTFAIAMNNRGQVIGNSTLTDETQHAFLWERGELKDLGTFGGTFGQAQGLNEAGNVVGIATVAGDQFFHAAVWNNGGITDVGTLPGDANSFGFDINEGGQVVALSTDSQFTTFRAFLWQKGRSMLDLESLAARSGLQLGQAIAFSGTANINNRGEIAANAVDANGNFHAVLLIPCGHVDTDCQDIRATGIEANAKNTPQNRVIADELHRRLMSGGIPAMMRARMAHSRRNLLP
jgi:probable HAF family extracellular repeat protein